MKKFFLNIYKRIIDFFVTPVSTLATSVNAKSIDILKTVFDGKVYKFFLNIKGRLFGENTFQLTSSAKKHEKKALLLPIRITLCYLALTLILYVIGPFNWITHRPFLFYSLHIFFLLAIWIGYRIGMMRRYPNAIVWEEQHDIKIIKFIQPLIVVNYIVLIVNIFRDYAFPNFDFIELFKEMFYGISHMGEGYALRYERLLNTSGSSVVGGSFFTLFNYAWAFIDYFCAILGIYYFKKLHKGSKLFLILYFITTVFFYLSIGTNIGVFRVILILILPLCLKTIKASYDGTIKRKSIIRLIALLVVLFSVVCVYFILTMKSRGGINYWEAPTYNIGGITVNKDSILFDIIPPPLHKLLVSMSSYLTQGYYAMSLALTVPWTPMFGMGNSMVIVNMVSEYLFDINQFTYQAKLLPFGWDDRIRWHSIYTWLANDFSFIGVILVMAIIGYLLGAMFKDALLTKNPFAKASLFYFTLLIIFIPCNNQLAQGTVTMFSFVAFIICWLLSKYNFKWVRQLLNTLKKATTPFFNWILSKLQIFKKLLTPFTNWISKNVLTPCKKWLYRIKLPNFKQKR